MGFKSLYYKLLVFYLFLSVKALDWSNLGSNNDLQESNGTRVQPPPYFYMAGAPVLAPKSEPIKRVGKIPIAQTPAPLLLFKSVCTTDIDWSHRVLVEIGPDEFKSCSAVKKIDLSHNFLSTLPANIFESNRILQILNLSNNHFQEINPLWFTASSESLEELDLSRNLLKTFPVKKFPEMNQLKHLSLAKNNLKDIDEEDIAEKFKALNRFEFTFNYIGCNRTEKLQAYFKSKNVTTAYSKIYRAPSVSYSDSDETEHPQNEKECINDEELLSQKLFNNDFIPLDGEVQVNSEMHVKVQANNNGPTNLKPIISSATFVIVFVISGCLSYII